MDKMPRWQSKGTQISVLDKRLELLKYQGVCKMNQILQLRKDESKPGQMPRLFRLKRGDDGLFSAEDTAAYDKMEAEVVNLGKEIERLERQYAIDLELSKATSTAIKNNPTLEKGKANSRATKEYNDAFWKSIRNKHGYEVMNALKVGEESEGDILSQMNLNGH